MSLDAASFLPVRIISEPAKRHDSHFMVELCSGMKAGDIAVFDKAYVAYGHLHTLNGRGIFWVTRAKDNARFEVKGEIKQGSKRAPSSGSAATPSSGSSGAPCWHTCCCATRHGSTRGTVPSSTSSR